MWGDAKDTGSPGLWIQDLPTQFGPGSEWKGEEEGLGWGCLPEAVVGRGREAGRVAHLCF